MIKIIRSLGVGLWKIQGLPFSSSYCFATESEITRKANKLHQAMTNFPQRKSKTQEKPKK